MASKENAITSSVPSKTPLNSENNPIISSSTFESWSNTNLINSEPSSLPFLETPISKAQVPSSDFLSNSIVNVPNNDISEKVLTFEEGLTINQFPGFEALSHNNGSDMFTTECSSGFKLDSDFSSFLPNPDTEEITQTPFDIQFADFFNMIHPPEASSQNTKVDPSFGDPTALAFLNSQFQNIPPENITAPLASTTTQISSSIKSLNNAESLPADDDDSSMDNTYNSAALEQWLLFKQKIGYRNDIDTSKEETEASCVVEEEEVSGGSNTFILGKEGFIEAKVKSVTFKEATPEPNPSPPQSEALADQTQANLVNNLTQIQNSTFSSGDVWTHSQPEQNNIDVSHIENFLTQQLNNLSVPQANISSCDNIVHPIKEEPQSSEEDMWKLFKHLTNYHATASIDIHDTLSEEVPVSTSPNHNLGVFCKPTEKTSSENELGNTISHKFDLPFTSTHEAAPTVESQINGDLTFIDQGMTNNFQEAQKLTFASDLNHSTTLNQTLDFTFINSDLKTLSTNLTAINTLTTRPNGSIVSEEPKAFVKSPSVVSSQGIDAFSDDTKIFSGTPITSSSEDTVSSDSVATPSLCPKKIESNRTSLQAYNKLSSVPIGNSPTPLLHSTILSRLAKCQVFLKLENLQAGGTHKIRGITQWITSMARCHGVSSTQGRQMDLIIGAFPNMCIAAAAAVDMFNTTYKPTQLISLRVVVPSRAPNRLTKILERFKVNIEVFGESWEDASNHVRTLLLKAEQKRRESKVPTSQFPVTLSIPSSHPELVRGMKRLSEEMRQQLSETVQREVLPDVIICPVGSGTLLESIASDLNTYDTTTKVQIIGVETHSTDTLHSSIIADQVVHKYYSTAKVSNDIFSLADPCLSHGAFEATLFRHITPLVVSDSMAANAALNFSEDHQFIIEPASAVALSPIYHNLLPNLIPDLSQNSVVVIVITGGNLIAIEDLARFSLRFRKPIIQARSKDNIFLDLSPPRTNSKYNQKNRTSKLNHDQPVLKKPKT